MNLVLRGVAISRPRPLEWYPGVQIHQSRDLVNWRLVSRPLTRADQPDMRGRSNSCGVWADGWFWLVYTDVKRLDGAFKDAQTCIMTCETINGAWSRRAHVRSSRFDPSLFHDADGQWVLNMRWNQRGPGSGANPAHDRLDGIEVQEWHPERGLTGPVHDFCRDRSGADRGAASVPA